MGDAVNPHMKRQQAGKIADFAADHRIGGWIFARRVRILSPA
ncbi:hypothetical protein [Croceicoccus sp. BE223]|nr:hypothetical protein [Croceicoccus sp. BE223]MDR7103435.1 hypothetical protein [Croceicoccus sp. BE223]